MGTRPWGEATTPARIPLARTPRITLAVNFPSPINHLGHHHPSQPPWHLLPPLPAEPWGRIWSGDTGVLLPPPPPTHPPTASPAVGHWALSQRCWAAAAAGLGVVVLVPPAPGIMALVGPDCWVPAGWWLCQCGTASCRCLPVLGHWRGKSCGDATRKLVLNSLNAQPRVWVWSLTPALAVAKRSHLVTCWSQRPPVSQPHRR